MAAEPADNLRELGELSDRHRVSRERAERVTGEMEEANDLLRRMLEDYRRSEDALTQATER
jgi:hypothetical protein